MDSGVFLFCGIIYLMRKIPDEVLEEIMKDWFYKKCCVADEKCSGRIEWHHNLIYAGKQVNEKWCILPICHYHHEHEKDKELGGILDYIMLCRATNEELEKYSKAINYIELRERLKLKFG